jgi:predicted SAM-dependent methyltransferase
MHMQFGCGLCAPPRWRNFDASPTLFLQRVPIVGFLLTKKKVVFPAGVEYGDVVKGLPLPDSSCQGVYCSHILEHLSLVDMRQALREAHRVLVVGGIFRLVVPDLEYQARAYLDNKSDDAALNFMKETGLGREVRSRSIMSFVWEWLGNSKHLWMWDFKSLRSELLQAGFHEIRRAKFCDSEDSKFSELEAVDRWRHCLGIECRKTSDS